MQVLCRKNVEFKEDSSFEDRFRSHLKDYKGSGYDRGHMVEFLTPCKYSYCYEDSENGSNRQSCACLPNHVAGITMPGSV